MTGEEPIGDRGILLGFEAARRVGQGPAGTQPLGSLVEQDALGGLQAGDFRRVHPPAKLEASSQDAGVGTRSVDENPVEKSRGRAEFVGCECLDTGGTEPGGVFPDEAEAGGLGVVGDDRALVAEELRDERGFPAGRGAQVENAFAGTWIEEMDGQQRARILDVEMALAKRREGSQGGMRREFEAESVGPVPFEGHGFDAFRGPPDAELRDVGPERVDPGVGGWRRIVPIQESAEADVAEALAPTVHQPAGMRPSDRGVRLAERGKVGPDSIAIAVASAEDGVEKSALVVEPGFPGEHDRLVDGGVGRDAIEEEELVDAEPEKILERGLLATSVGAAGDDPIECRALSKNAVNQLLGEASVGGREAPEIRIGLETMLEKVAWGVGMPQGTIGNLSWSGFHRAAILTVNQETASPQFSPGWREAGKHRGFAVDGRAVAAVLPRGPAFWFWSRP